MSSPVLSCMFYFASLSVSVVQMKGLSMIWKFFIPSMDVWEVLARTQGAIELTLVVLPVITSFCSKGHSKRSPWLLLLSGTLHTLFGVTSLFIFWDSSHDFLQRYFSKPHRNFPAKTSIHSGGESDRKMKGLLSDPEQHVDLNRLAPVTE